jgi:hypothetical protein
MAEDDIFGKNRVSGIFGIFTVIFQDITPSFLRYRDVLPVILVTYTKHMHFLSKALTYIYK